MAQTRSLDGSCHGSSVAILTSGCSVDPPPIPRFGLVHEWTCAGMRYGVVELGSSVAPPAMLYDVDGAGQCTGSTAFLDHSPYFAIACNPGPDRDGTTRCLPEGLRIEDAFSDAACTIPVRFATDIRIPECRDAPGAPYPSLLGSDGAHVYRIGPESHEAMYLPDPFSGVCGRRASLNEVIFEVIEVAPSALALIEKVQE